MFMIFLSVENFETAFKPLNLITGYMVLAVDDTGKIKPAADVGDKVLLMCGAPCRTTKGSYDPQYQWKDSSGKILANTREHTITTSSNGFVTFTCEILNSECISKVSFKKVEFNVNSK